MRTMKTTLITVFIVMFVFTFFISADNSSAMSASPGIYHAFGRVLDQEGLPVGNCSVVLIKSLVGKNDTMQAGEVKTEVTKTVTDEAVVSTTDLNGNFSFVFEPLTANDFWVVFMAEGYKTRSVELNKIMRSRFFQKPNKSPIKVDVVLEKE